MHAVRRVIVWVRARPWRRRGLLAVAAVLLAGLVVLPGAGRDATVAPTTVVDGPVRYVQASVPVDQRVEDLLSRMTLDEKVGQMTMIDREAVMDDPSTVTKYGLGALLSGGDSASPTPNTAASWADVYDRLQRAALETRLKIPLLYGTDAVHGHNNVRGATIGLE